jgi:hypothetical protein
MLTELAASNNLIIETTKAPVASITGWLWGKFFRPECHQSLMKRQIIDIDP